MKSKTLLGTLIGCGIAILATGAAIDSNRYGPSLNKHYTAAQPYVSWIAQERKFMSQLDSSTEEHSRSEREINAIKRVPEMVAYESKASSLNTIAQVLCLGGVGISVLSLAGLAGIVLPRENNKDSAYLPPPFI